MDMGPILGASNNANLYKLWQFSWISRWHCSVWVGNTMTPDRLEDSVMLQGLMNWWDISCIWRSKEDDVQWPSSSTKMITIPEKNLQWDVNHIESRRVPFFWYGAGPVISIFFTKELVYYYPVTTPRRIKVHIDPSARRQARWLWELSVRDTFE